MLNRARAAAALLAASALLTAPSAAARSRHTRPLSVGLDGYGQLSSEDPYLRNPLITLAHADGAQLIRITVPWAVVAPDPPPGGVEPTDPSDRTYSWRTTDALVRAITAGGLSVMIMVDDAPSWAEGQPIPPGASPGSWRPQPAAFGRFAEALARRYSGVFPDPLFPGHTLPAVRDWEAWNEPNLNLYLAPQWVTGRHGESAASPGIYRNLVNAFYAGVKHVSRRNLVIAGATAPFGDAYPGAPRIPPVPFVRQLLCLRPGSLRALRCHRAHFDVLDHHPFDIAGPERHAVNPGDVSVPDMPKLTRLLAAARRHHTILPRGRKRVWATELAWSSRPPDPSGVPVQRQARWLEQALFILWRAGIDTVLWLQLVDDPPGGLDAGLLYRTGRAKPALTAYRFPFVGSRRRHATWAWGRAPVAGTVLVELRRHRRWSTVRRLTVGPGATFYVRLAVRGHAVLRAQVGRYTSLTWTLR